MSDADQALSRFIADARAVPPLDREEEQQLARRWLQHQDRAAADRLTKASLRHVASIALKYRRYGIPVRELIAEGNVGLVTALRKFDPEKGVRFVTYAAYWIRAYVLNHVLHSWSMVGSGGPLRSKYFFMLRREAARMSQLTAERDRAMTALAEKMKLSVPEVEGMLQRLEARDVSLDQPVYDDADETRLDRIADRQPEPEQSLEEAQRASIVQLRVGRALEGLDARERFIIERRFFDDDELSLAELGRQLGVSRERARQLEARAREKLRRALEDLSPLREAA